jgi:transposase
MVYFISAYFQSFGTETPRAVVESTTGWYWLDDLLKTFGVELVLAHAKYLKAIAYAKVKTDKVDERTLAQLLRMNYIPIAHKIRLELREVRDLTRARLCLVWKRTSCYNSIHRLGEKFNCDHLIDNDVIQHLLWIPAFGRITAFSVYLEIDGIERFASEKQLFSYARVVVLRQYSIRAQDSESEPLSLR